MSFIDTLLSRMTLEEKLGQMTMTASGQTVTGPVIAGDSTDSIRAGAIGNLLNLYGASAVHNMQDLAVRESRLGIPLLFALDVIHGHRHLFPIPLAEAGIFDPQAWEESARIAACEAAADGIAMTFAPMADVSRDPRWGRTAEGPGEDPWVAAQWAYAKVRGFQGDNLASAERVAAVVKHFCAYGAVSAGRDYASVDISERTLHEVHLPAFEAAVDAGVAAVMPAFTDLAGVPMTAHRALLKTHLRDRLGFQGVIVTDYTAIAELLKHGVAESLAHAAALALHAGVDIDMMSDAFRKGLPEALTKGWVHLEQIDAAVGRILRLKERLGLFDDPYRRGSAVPPSTMHGWRDEARRNAGRSLVLLKNQNHTLPLVPARQRLALIGPMSNAAEQMRGCWWAAGTADDHVPVLAGISNRFGQASLRQLDGVPLVERIGRETPTQRFVAEPDNGSPDFSPVLDACDWATHIVLCLGESATMTGEAASRANPDLPGRQADLASVVFERARTAGIPVILVLFCGRPLMITSLLAQADAVLLAWYPGCEAGHAIADVLSGHRSPGGKLPISWPVHVGQVPVFFAQRPGGRPENPSDFYTSKYLDMPNSPLYPFGFGLSYGRWEIDQVRASASPVQLDDTIDFRFRVRNSGSRGAEGSFFVFAHDRVACVSRPVLQLLATVKVTLEPHAATVCSVGIPARSLMFLGPDLVPVYEAGDVDLLVGESADQQGLQGVCITLAAHGLN